MPQQFIRVDSNRISRLPPRYIPLLEQAMDEAAEVVLDRVQRNLSRPYRGFPSRPGDPPRLRTGRLRSSYVWRRTSRGRRVIKAVGRYARLADIMENGGGRATIRPRRRRAITIPVTRAVARAMAARMDRGGRRKRRRGRTYLDRIGAFESGGQIYLLRRRARRGRIKPRPHLAPAVRQSSARIQRIVRQAMVGAGRTEMVRLDRAAGDIFGPSPVMSEAFNQAVR